VFLLIFSGKHLRSVSRQFKTERACIVNEIDDKYKITIVKPYNKKPESSQANPRMSLIMEKGFLFIGQCNSFNFKDGTEPEFPETVMKL
jgi:spermidine synthase